MSNLSQFYGGGGPSNILRGSTSFQTSPTPAPTPGSGITVVTVNTGVFVNASTTYLTQGVRGDAQTYTVSTATFGGGGGTTTGSFTGSGSARINGSGEIVITSGVGVSQFTSGGPFGTSNTRSAVQKGIVDWEAVEFD